MRRLGLDDLRAIVTDATELAKGARLEGDGGLANLARHDARLYADAAGAAAAPYKVTITFGDGAKVTARCTCMAARTRPFCKHAAALLVAWANGPEAFVESDRPPPGAPVDKKRAVKRGKRDQAALRADGVARAITLVRELAATGVASVAAGRADAVRDLAEALRAATRCGGWRRGSTRSRRCWRAPTTAAGCRRRRWRSSCATCS
ncbi:MAG: SWIM zinc finger family protein [Kofleriaceae bacterium]|nr:SWIM zinc finger family protein [Kofleriaceae bacterium]